MSGLVCAHCLVSGLKFPTSINHIGMEQYARYAKTIISGDALCEDHAKKVIREIKRSRR